MNWRAVYKTQKDRRGKIIFMAFSALGEEKGMEWISIMQKRSTKATGAVLMFALMLWFLPVTALAYTDQELCDMALLYRAATAPYTPAIAEIDHTSGNTVTIHLYDIVQNHTATYAWYTVDRDSGIGTDLNGVAIDLSPYAPAPPVPDNTRTETPPVTEPEPVVPEDSLDGSTESATVPSGSADASTGT